MLGGFDFYNFITSSEGKEIVVNGWKTAGIYDALELGRKKLPSIDPFQDIDPLVIGSNVDTNVSAVCQLHRTGRNRSNLPPKRCEQLWRRRRVGEMENPRNIFDILDDFDDDQSL